MLLVATPITYFLGYWEHHLKAKPLFWMVIYTIITIHYIIRQGCHWSTSNLIGHYAVYKKITIGPCKVGGIIHEGTYAVYALITSTESRPWRTFTGTYNDQRESYNFLGISHNGFKLKKINRDSFVNEDPVLDVSLTISSVEGDVDGRIRSDWV